MQCCLLMHWLPTIFWGILLSKFITMMHPGLYRFLSETCLLLWLLFGGGIASTFSGCSMWFLSNNHCSVVWFIGSLYSISALVGCYHPRLAFTKVSPLYTCHFTLVAFWLFLWMGWSDSSHFSNKLYLLSGYDDCSEHSSPVIDVYSLHIVWIFNGLIVNSVGHTDNVVLHLEFSLFSTFSTLFTCWFALFLKCPVILKYRMS